MAAQVRLIRLAWENEANFKMDTKLDDGEWTTIISVDENGFLDQLWDSGIATVCTKYFETALNIIGTEMKA